MTKLTAIILSIMLTMSAVGLGAQENKKVINFAVDPTFPPLEYIDANGRLVGYGIDYFTAVCQESGLEANFVQENWEGIFNRLNDGNYDAIMASVTITPERRKTMNFTIPYHIVRQSLIVPQNSSVANIRQLKGLRIGILTESTAVEIAEKIQEAKLQTFPSVEEAIKALVDGQLDAVICEDVVGANFLVQPDIANKIKMVAVINTPGAEELYAVAVRKNNLDILVALNDGIKAVKTNGIEAELRRKWIRD